MPGMDPTSNRLSSQKEKKKKEKKKQPRLILLQKISNVNTRALRKWPPFQMFLMVLYMLVMNSEYDLC